MGLGLGLPCTTARGCCIPAVEPRPTKPNQASPVYYSATQPSKSHSRPFLPCQFAILAFCTTRQNFPSL